MRGTEPSVPAFGGIAGRVLQGALSAGTWLSGLTLVFLLGILGYILRQFEAGDAHTVFIHLGITLALARFARNGLAGEWSGSLFTSPGGSWLDVLRVGLRYTALSAVWWIPVLLLGWRPEAVGEALGQAVLGGGGGLMLSLTTLVLTLAALTPPVFLIVAVGAERTLDIAAPGTWRRLFSGRGGDLFLVYAIYLGGLGMALLLILPLFAAVAFQNMDLALFLGFFALAFTAGLSLDLLGRLSGFFAASSGADPLPEETPAAVDPPGDVLDRGPAPTTTPHTSRPRPAQAPVAGNVETGALALPPATAPPRGRAGGRPPLLDARERLDEFERRFASDPDGALALLGELRQMFAPHPLVLHRLCVGLSERGFGEESLEVAREALPLCLERGALRLAAEIFAAHQARGNPFQLPRETVLALAQDLRRHGDLAGAELAYSGLRSRDRGETRALKGLIQVAEGHLEQGEAAEAQRIFRHLLDTSEESPLTMHLRAGLAAAERRLAKAS